MVSKMTLLRSSLGLSLLALAGNASALLITDTVDIGVELSAGQSVEWTHEFYDDALFPQIGTINEGTVTVSFVDDNDWLPEIAFGISDGTDWAIGEVDTGDYAFSVGLSGLYDGIFGIRITSLFGDFTVDSSTLTIDFDPGPVAVPEPGILSLLGAGLIGIGIAGRRRRKAAAVA